MKRLNLGWLLACRWVAAAAVLSALLISNARAELLINEIYFDPPSNPDSPKEYIELRGTPGMSLSNHYLLFIENENNTELGQIETFFDLNGRTMGTNGFLTLRQKDSPFSVAPGTTDLVNSGFGIGFGSSAAASSIGARDQGGEGEIENSGFTAMLINSNGMNLPTLGFDLDGGNNGLDVATGRAGWTILDSIGIHSEFGESSGRLYAPVNFGPESDTNIEAGATYVGLGYEIEYIGRYGSSTGQTAADWHISNLTDNPLSGFSNTADWRQSGEPHGIGAPGQFVETNQGVPYGTNLTGSLGAPNYPGVPEPTSAAVAAAGALALVGFSRRLKPTLRESAE